MVVTASGGGWKEAYTAIAALICRNFTNPSPAMTTTVTLSITNIRFAILSFFDPGGFAPADPPRLRSRGPLPRSAPAGAPVARLSGGFAPADPPRLRSRGPLPRSAPAGAPVARLSGGFAPADPPRLRS